MLVGEDAIARKILCAKNCLSDILRGKHFGVVAVNIGSALALGIFNGCAARNGGVVYLDRFFAGIEAVIERLTGDGAKSTLIAPTWTLNKRNVLNSIDKRLSQLDAWQGDRFEG